MESTSGHSKPLREDSSYKKLAMDSEMKTDTDSNWLITLSDLMSLLLVFFIMFHFMSRISSEKKSAPGNRNVVSAPSGAVVNDRIEQIRDEMNSAIKDMGLDQDVVVQTAEKEVVVTIKDKVTFKSGEADVIVGSEPILDKIADIIRRYPSLTVEIDGHTDNVPINTRRYPSNWELSVARSANVLKYFVDRDGIGPSRLFIKGEADQKPLAPNDTEQERALNRRVEIRLIERGDNPPASPSVKGE
jgi:chemotaxis protein MotB